uniref:Uncharacterized protein n=1 Tax=Periophthalmus magnuspinnatus TaxID=409849 RepID=A0A3B4BHR2_9GOBI
MRSYHGCVALDCWVYLIGGCSSIKVLNSVAPMSRHRRHVSVVVLNECYNPETNRWTPIAPMKKRRSRAGAAALEGKVSELNFMHVTFWRRHVTCILSWK